MHKLFSADFNYFIKSKIFVVQTLGALATVLFIVFANYSPAVQNSAQPIKPDDIFFIFYQLIIVIIACSVALFNGAQYSDGAIRNKLIVGHRRKDIYFSAFALNIVSTLSLVIIHVVFTLLPGHFLFGSFEQSPIQTAVYIAILTLDCIVFAAFFTAISVNIQNRSVSVIICVLSSLLSMYLGGLLHSRLQEPEMTYDKYVLSLDGVELGNLIENPAYVSGIKRTVFELLENITPMGQILKICESEQPQVIWAVYSVALISVATALGITVFKKKDLK